MSTPQEDLAPPRCPAVPTTAASAGDRTEPLPVSSTHLAALPLDQVAVVHSLGGQRAFRRRLLELGFVPGTPAVVRNVAPLGDPLEIEIRGCRVSIRRAEAEQVVVVAEPPAAGGGPR